MDIREAYLKLLKKTLTFALWEDNYYILSLKTPETIKNRIRNYVIRIINKGGYVLAKQRTRTMREIENGIGWPQKADTMVGMKRLDNLEYCCKSVIENNINGDFIEAGVWRGGAAIFMKAVVNVFSDRSIKVWVADSFEGLPVPDETKYPEDKGDEHYKWDVLKVSLDEVRSNFLKYDSLDDNVIFLKGWFKDTLPSSKIDKLSVIRLDGDIYESTWESLIYLYPKLQAGGFIIIDDYYNNASCRKAVDDYRNANQILEEIIRIDWTGAFWQRGDI